MATRAIEIQNKIREGVLNGDFPGGMRMNEVDLATSLGVSRTPVRNALSTLGAEGLLDYTPNSGYVVRSYSSKDIADIYEVRAVLDGLAAKTLAEQGLSDARRGACCTRSSPTAQTSLRSGAGRTTFAGAGSRSTRNSTPTSSMRPTTSICGPCIRKAKDIPLVTELRFRWFDGSDMNQSQSEHSEIFDAIVNKQVDPGRRACARTHLSLRAVASSSTGACSRRSSGPQPTQCCLTSEGSLCAPVKPASAAASR